MRFTITAAVLAFATSVFAQTPGFDVISKPTADEVVPAGAIYEIEWAPNTNWTGTVTISLLGGASQSLLNILSPLAQGVDSNAGKYDWAVKKTLGEDKVYGILIALDSDKTVFQYSHPFAIKAADGVADNVSSTTSTPADQPSAVASTVVVKSSTTEAVTSAATPTPSAVTVSSYGALSTSTTSSASQTGSSTGSSTSSSTPSSTPSFTPSSVPANNAAGMGATSIALFGGLVMALFAL